MRLRISLFLCIASLFLTGWGHKEPKVRIGLSLDHAQGREALVDHFKNELDEDNVELLLEDAKGNLTTQQDQVRDLVQQGVQALVLLPCDPSKAAPLVDVAHRAGIKVVSLGQIIPHSDLDYLVAFNNVKAGQSQAQALVRKVPKGRYVLLGGASTDTTSRDLREGQMKVLQPLIDKGDIQIVASQWARPSEAAKKTETILAREKNNVDAVLASDGGTAEGVIRALEEKKLSGKVAVAGLGEDLATCRRILSGTQTMTVYQPPQKLAEETAYLAAKLAHKATQFDCQFTEVGDGSQKTRAVLLTPLAVDAKNLDSTVIQDKVQKKEEVYGK